MLELDRLPRSLLWLAGAVGTVGIVGAALLAGEKDFLGRLGARGSELVGALAFGFAGLSELALRFRKRIHRGRTQDLAVLTLERVESELSALAQRVFRILAQATPEAEGRSLDIGPAFRVPIEETQRAYWHDAMERVATQRDAFEFAAKPVADSLEELSKAQCDEQIRAAREEIELLAERLRGAGATGPESSSERTESVAVAKSAPSTSHASSEAEGASEEDAGPEPLKSRYKNFIKFAGGKPDPVLDIASLVQSANDQLPALQEQWSALAEASTQLALLLEGDEARSLLERNLELRAGLSTQGASQEPVGLSEDPDQRALQLQLWRIGRGNDAYRMVLTSLRSAWTMLEALDDVFRRRVGHCDGARRHGETKQTFDAMAALARQEHTVEQQIEKLRDETQRQRQQIHALATQGEASNQ